MLKGYLILRIPPASKEVGFLLKGGRKTIFESPTNSVVDMLAGLLGVFLFVFCIFWYM